METPLFPTLFIKIPNERLFSFTFIILFILSSSIHLSFSNIARDDKRKVTKTVRRAH